MFIAIDPGIATGWSLWNTTGLVACGLGDPRTCPKHVVVPIDLRTDSIHDVWIESPVIYPRSKARPNDILLLARGAGEWGGIYKTVAVDVHYVEPAAWKGQVPKEIHHVRVWAALREFERALVDDSCRGVAPSKRHNVLDAVGLGQWVRARGKAGK